MVALFVSLMFIGLLLTDLILQRVEARKAIRAAERLAAPGDLASWVTVPEGVRISPGHSWAMPLQEGTVRAGVDSLVANAVGIDKKRGDVLDIRNMEFKTEDFEEATRQIAENERRSYVKNLIVYSVIGLVILLFFLFVVRPFIKWLTENTVDSVDTFLPQTIEELEKMSGTAALPGLEEAVPVLPEKIDPEKVEGEMIKEKIITLVDSNPHKAALIVRDWLKEEPSKKAEKKVGGAKGA